MATEWFCEISDEQLGPLSSQQLKAMADAGRLIAGDRVRQGAEGSWVPAGRVKGLFPAAGSSAKVFDSGDVPVARPVDAPSGSGQPAPLPIAEPVDLPVAQPVSGSPQGSAQGKSAATPLPAPAPPRPARGPAPTGGLPGIVTEANPRMARVTGHGSVNLGDRRHKRQRQHVVVVVCLLLLLLALGGTAAWVAIWKPRLPDSSSDNDGQVADAGGNDKRPASDKPAAGERWIDASSQSGKCGDVSVKIISVETGYPRFVPRAQGVDRNKEHVMIRVELKNTKTNRKIVYYLGFGRSSGIKLSDDAGNQYDRIPAGSVEGQLQKEKEPLHPNEPVEDLLVFQRLVPGVKYLRLELPGSVLEENQDLRFQIPGTMIGEATTRPLDPDPFGDDDEPVDPEPPGDDAEPVPSPEPDPPAEKEDPDAPKPIPGLSGDDSPTEPKPPPDPTGIFGKPE